ncbi:unnamed protein product [Protopolystoma xenopodis]|uniref:Uncharacterized protein n=1 Tax=Protopolystoma xenopodis TaxID=117903 RepID=A0A448XBV3_9PLAT|nr:unnamed protein product [Protopolystoma xenopodis]
MKCHCISYNLVFRKALLSSLSAISLQLYPIIVAIVHIHTSVDKLSDYSTTAISTVGVWCPIDILTSTFRGYRRLFSHQSSSIFNEHNVGNKPCAVDARKTTTTINLGVSNGAICRASAHTESAMATGRPTFCESTGCRRLEFGSLGPRSLRLSDRGPGVSLSKPGCRKPRPGLERLTCTHESDFTSLVDASNLGTDKMLLMAPKDDLALCNSSAGPNEPSVAASFYPNQEAEEYKSGKENGEGEVAKVVSETDIMKGKRFAPRSFHAEVYDTLFALQSLSSAAPQVPGLGAYLSRVRGVYETRTLALPEARCLELSAGSMPVLPAMVSPMGMVSKSVLSSGVIRDEMNPGFGSLARLPDITILNEERDMGEVARRCALIRPFGFGTRFFKYPLSNRSVRELGNYRFMPQITYSHGHWPSTVQAGSHD